MKKDSADDDYSHQRLSSSSELIAFLSKNHLFLSSKSSKDLHHPLTHTLMDGRGGGCVSVPDRDLGAFYAAYGADVAKGCPLFVVERRSEIFKMHFDLDFTSLHTEVQLDAVLNTIVSSVGSFVVPATTTTAAAGGKEAWCIACAVLDSETRAPAHRLSEGIHLIFPWLQVDTERALWIRSSVLATLQAHHRHGALEEDWEKVVDIAVFTSNGMRMVGSDKIRECKTCRNDKAARSFCANCKGMGRVPEHKVYWPWKTYPSESTADLLKDLLANPAHSAHLCSTRVPQSRALTDKFRVPEGTPSPHSLMRRAALLSSTGKIERRGRWLNEEATTTTTWRNATTRTTPVELHSDLASLLVEAFARVDPRYTNLEVRQIDTIIGNDLTAHKTQMYSVKVRGGSSHFCQNKKCDHRQQNIYFVISPGGGISQRCFSRKNVQYASGLCENYTSPPVPIGDALRHALFGEENDTALAKVGGPAAIVVRADQSQLTQGPPLHSNKATAATSITTLRDTTTTNVQLNFVSALSALARRQRSRSAPRRRLPAQPLLPL